MVLVLASPTPHELELLPGWVPPDESELPTELPPPDEPTLLPGWPLPDEPELFSAELPLPDEPELLPGWPPPDEPELVPELPLPDKPELLPEEPKLSSLHSKNQVATDRNITSAAFFTIVSLL
jgi:hypothetical protein